MVVSNNFISKGTILTPLWTRVHRSNIYFENPQEFNPNRFLDDSKLISQLLAFSSGPRICIGKQFALLEMMVILTKFLLNFSWTLKEGYTWSYKFSATTTSPIGGVPIYLKKRK